MAGYEFVREPHFQSWLEKEKLVAPKLKIGGQHEVTEIKRDAAQVGCTRVTRAEVEQLLKEMDSAPKSYSEFTIEKEPASTTGYTRLTLRRDFSGFAAGSSDVNSVYDCESTGFDIRALHMCLSRENAQKLFEFLGGALGHDSYTPESQMYKVKLQKV